MSKRVFAVILSSLVLASVFSLGPAAPAWGGVTDSCFGSNSATDPSSNVITGTPNDDTIVGTAARDVIMGLGGDDKIIGLAGNDVICGSSDANTSDDGSDIIRAGEGFDLLVGGRDDDQLFGNAHRDNLFGSGGDDLINGGADAGLGDDANYWFSSLRVIADLATGVGRGEGRDTLVNVEGLGGSDHDDVLSGDPGVNSFDGLGGDDKILGGRGVDTLGLIFTNGNNFVNLRGGTAVGDGADTLRNLENVIGSSQDDYITGSGGPNGLFGAEGNDTMYGRAGDDIMLGFADRDTMFGGAGVADFVSYSDRPDLAVNLNLLTGKVRRDDGNDTLDGVEMVEGSARADEIIGDHGPNFFYADEGNDRVNGNGGSDLIFFLAAENNVVVDLSLRKAWGMAPTFDRVTDIENVVGSSYEDNITGDNSRNFLNGSDGHDRVKGAGHDDYLAGGAGDDFVSGGPGSNDLMDFFQSNAAVTANLNLGEAVGEGFDTLAGIESLSGTGEADTLTGSDDANALYGEKGEDKLFGLGGGDRLDGGRSADSLNGGASVDKCFRKAESSSCEKFKKPNEHPLAEVGRRYKKALASTRRYKRRYK